MTEVHNSKIESEDEKLEKQFLLYFQSEDYNAKELREAYYLLCGISEGEVSERVNMLKVEMEEMTEKRYPLNRFVKLISVLEGWEDSGIHFTSFVNDLNITQKEKDMLQSIVDKNRAGELVCIVDGSPVAKFKINENVSSTSAAYALRVKLSEILLPLLKGSQKADVSFWFEEK